MKIICDDKIPFLKGVLEPYAEVIYLPGNKISNPDVIDADALIVRTRTMCNAQLLEGSSVKFIGTATIGYDHIDTHWLSENNIAWQNAPGCNANSVVQYVAAALQLLQTEKKADLNKLTIGIIGAGNVGSRVAHLATSLGIKTLVNDPPRERVEKTGFVSLERIFKEADILTFHTPLIREGIDKTYHLFNPSVLSQLKPGVIVINTSRGEVTETNALLNGIESGIISNLILDVWENEPNLNLKLLEKTFIGTPHIAGYSVDGKANGTAMIVQALSRTFNLPLNNWVPDSLPQPLHPLITIDNTKLPSHEVIAQAILHTYPLLNDHHHLLISPQKFEEQRGSYPHRREFGAYTVLLQNEDKALLATLKKIGFNAALR
jgi:erythronate-4-phosphate dehydrogenase